MKYKNMDWLKEVWRIKKELSQEAINLGLEIYLTRAEKEADKIFPSRMKKDEHILVRDKHHKSD